MIKFILVIFLSAITCMGTAQVFPYEDIKLEKPGDYAATESLALSAANVIITRPYIDKDANRENAARFLSKWMIGNKEHDFYLKGRVYDVKDDKILLQLYIAAMAKYSLENKTESVNPLTVEKRSSKLVLAYYDDPKNNVNLKKKYRKILETN
ncbi:MAG: hypothetical protein IPL84_17115 [Chitinophagaceae bacterium]|nr:hypothetical protein [Chitinophagaceae bacterium]